MYILFCYSYIQHLMDALESDDPQPLEEFKADLSRKTPCRAEKRKCIEEEIVSNKQSLWQYHRLSYWCKQ